jgi:hypothetical protein
MTLRPFTTKGLRQTLNRMKLRSASGPDFWAVANLKNLPDPIFALLPELFTLIENSTEWPVAMLYGFCALIPKTAGDTSPLGQRPLGIMSVLYRLFCAYRLQDVIAWQEHFLHESQHGFRTGHFTDDVFYDISLRIEDALCNGTALIGIHYDYKKAFDLLPRCILFKIAEQMGFCPKLLKLMKHIYSNLKRYFRIPGGLSDTFVSSCGILQGCPLSVCFLNLMMGTWARTIVAETESIPQVFADDSMILAHDIDTAKKACHLTGEFAKITKQELAMSKTMAWATTTRDRAAPRRIRFDGHTLNVMLDVASLGARLCTSHARIVSHYAQRIQEAIRISDHISSLPLSGTERGQICATKVLPKVLFASEISAPSMADLGKLRSAIARAIWRKRASRSTEVILSLLHPIHRVDPASAWAYTCINQFRRMSLRRPDLLPSLRKLWGMHSTKSSFGPVSTLRKALKILSWTWTDFDYFTRPSAQPLYWFRHSRAYFQHQIREAMRSANLSIANKRQDLKGVGNRIVDRHIIRAVLRQCNEYQKGTYSAILSGGFRSAKQFCKAGIISNPICPFCGQTEEDVEHIFIHCVAWHKIRLKFPDVSLD